MCDSVVATGPHTASGLTLFGKNSDRKAGECQPFVQFSQAQHPPGSDVRCTHISIPQVRETFRVMGHSPWWVWGFEHGVNQYGLVIGNQAVFSRQIVEERPGLIGMDLVRLALERSRNREEAVDCISSLLETYGQGGSAFAPGGAGYHNSFNIADSSGAVFMETSGRHWVVRDVELDGLSNHLCSGSDWDRISEGLETFAREEGFWEEDGPVHVERALRNPHIPLRLSDGRLRRSRELLATADGSLDIGRIQSLLRDHGEGYAVPPVGATLEDDHFFHICVHTDPPGPTTASMVASIPNDLSKPWPVWVSFAVPCGGVFLPVYLDGTIPAALARGSECVEDGADSLWWKFTNLERAASKDLAKSIPFLREAWKPFEEQVECDRVEAEEEAVSLTASGDLHGASLRLSRFMEATAASAARCADEFASKLNADA